MRDKIAAAHDRAERDWLFGCKKNLYAAIQNMIRLEEARVRPEDIGASDRDLSLFLEMWKYLERLDGSIAAFRNKLHELEQPENFEREAERAFRFHGNKVIV